MREPKQPLKGAWEYEDEIRRWKIRGWAGAVLLALNLSLDLLHWIVSH